MSIKLPLFKYVIFPLALKSQFSDHRSLVGHSFKSFSGKTSWWPLSSGTTCWRSESCDLTTAHPFRTQPYPQLISTLCGRYAHSQLKYHITTTLKVIRFKYLPFRGNFPQPTSPDMSEHTFTLLGLGFSCRYELVTTAENSRKGSGV